MAKSKTRILIVDDHPVLRRGLSELLRQQADLEVCGQMEGVAEAVRFCRAESPDLVLIDMSLKDGHGLDLIKELKTLRQPPKMLVISMYEQASYAERALRAGARGYLPKSEAADEIIAAIRTVLAGGVYVNKHMTEQLLHSMVGGPSGAGRAPEDVLSDRELQVFESLGQGLGTREISERLSLGYKTVDSYRQHIKQKLGLTDGNELIFRAILWAHGDKR
ncbi:MAG TPA: response regulator transcription factor [Phycisphaerae bacterium]|nr:response regulator transcription factor [Phycisphaerae bacterium]